MLRTGPREGVRVFTLTPCTAMEVSLDSDNKSGQDKQSKRSTRLPDHVRNLMECIAEVRRAVLENTPGLLPQVAPALVAAEAQVALLIDQ